MLTSPGRGRRGCRRKRWCPASRELSRGWGLGEQLGESSLRQRPPQMIHLWTCVTARGHPPSKRKGRGRSRKGKGQRDGRHQEVGKWPLQPLRAACPGRPEESSPWNRVSPTTLAWQLGPQCPRPPAGLVGSPGGSRGGAGQQQGARPVSHAPRWPEGEGLLSAARNAADKPGASCPHGPAGAVLRAPRLRAAGGCVR